MALPEITGDGELTGLVALVDHDSAVQGAADQQGMLLHEHDLDNLFVLVVELFAGVDVLQFLAGLAAELAHEAAGVPDEEAAAFEAELAGCYVGLVVGGEQPGEELLQRPSEVVVHAHIVGGEDKDLVGEGAELEVEDVMELVDLLGFFLQCRGPELSDLLLADQDLEQLGDHLEPGWVNEDLLAVDELDGLKLPEVPDPEDQLVIERQHVGVGLEELGPHDGAGVLGVLAREALRHRDIQGVDEHLVAEPEGQHVVAELAGVPDAQDALLLALIDHRRCLLGNVFESIALVQILGVQLDVPVHGGAGDAPGLVDFDDVSDGGFVVVEHLDQPEGHECPAGVVDSRQSNLAGFRGHSPDFVVWQVLYLVEVPVVDAVFLVQENHSRFYFDISEEQRLLKDASHNAAVLINTEVSDRRFAALWLQVYAILQLETSVVDFDRACLIFYHEILLGFVKVDNLADVSLALDIVDFVDLVLVRDFGIGRGDDLVLLVHFVLVLGLLHHADVLDNVLGKLGPLEMAVPVDVDGLEKFYQVRHKEVLRDFVVGNVQLFDQVDEGRQLQPATVELEFFLEVLHVLLGEDGHDPLHMPLVVVFPLEQARVSIEVLNHILQCADVS